MAPQACALAEDSHLSLSVCEYVIFNPTALSRTPKTVAATFPLQLLFIEHPTVGVHTARTCNAAAAVVNQHESFLSTEPKDTVTVIDRPGPDHDGTKDAAPNRDVSLVVLWATKTSSRSDNPLRDDSARI
jgi:hypothetical protein